MTNCLPTESKMSSASTMSCKNILQSILIKKIRLFSSLRVLFHLEIINTLW